jgi:hypothetical protein
MNKNYFFDEFEHLALSCSNCCFDSPTSFYTAVIFFTIASVCGENYNFSLKLKPPQIMIIIIKIIIINDCAYLIGGGIFFLHLANGFMA